MMYVDFAAGQKEYKLRLGTRAVVALEKMIGCNPLSIFDIEDEMPTVTTMVCVLHASLQAMHHGITMTDAYDIFDAYLADGNTVTDFLPVIVDIYKVSGLLKGENVAKN